VNLFQGQTPAQRIATEMFADQFETMIDITETNVTTNLTLFSQMPAGGGRIRLSPGDKQALLSFIGWTRHMIRLGIDPSTIPFPIGDAKTLTSTMNYEDWYPTFYNYLSQIPGRNGVPISYIIRDDVIPTTAITGNHMVDYINFYPHGGDSYNMDNDQVSIHLLSLIVGNTELESIIQALDAPRDGRLMNIAIKEHHRGVGMYRKDVVKAENIINSSFYSGEKVPHMWWNKFERDFSWAFSVIDKQERRTVYSEEQKLRLVLPRIKASFLESQLSAMKVLLNQIPIGITYFDAMRMIRTEVHQKFPQYSNQGCGGRGNQNQQQGNIGRYTYHRRDQVPTTRQGSSAEKLTNEKWVEYHPGATYSYTVYNLFPSELKDRLTRQRQEHCQNNNSNDNREINELCSQISQLQSQMHNNASLPPLPPPDIHPPTPPPVGQIDTEVQSRISQVTGTNGNSIMGGRAEQQQRCNATPTPPGGLYNIHGRRVSNVISKV